MNQTALINTPSGERLICIPNPSTELMPGVCWGRFDHLFTPAFWSIRAQYAESHGLYRQHKLGRDFTEEVIACLLGGFGMPAELGIAAFNRLSERSLISHAASEDEIKTALLEPLEIRGKFMRYRYPHQKARYVASALRRLNSECPPSHNAVAFRDWLLSFDGIGLKTASWVARNYLGSDEVAVLDIHIIRAGLLAGVFERTDRVEKSYLQMERRLVDFAKALGLKLSFLDALIWDEMRQMGWIALHLLSSEKTIKPR
ncbi:Thermostable 8-oxoguanine DNA glycosylase [Prosthecobacter debontii]|uniref:Thermostable 8-oxoguanine DNA glycosylase n=1 Tax=Prosthecobacter debontii TaxID=48467 RepID=A0A1T4Z2E9_9BACT|nr:hypothetical protein [Prosthecobacter debontii]SKB08126.1 Thermostable 8-oxoguanine DNA glycosylase [Prosthecobacter debontii]